MSEKINISDYSVKIICLIMSFVEYFKSRRLQILTLGYFILIIQNLLLPFSGRNPYLVLLVFHLDLLGFSLLALGYLSHSPAGPRGSYILGSLFFLSWVLVRIVNQHVLPLIFDFSDLHAMYDTVPDFLFIPFAYNLRAKWSPTIPAPPLLMLNLYFLNAFVLFFAFFFCEHYPFFNSQQKGAYYKSSIIISMVYTISNVIAVSFHISEPLRAIISGEELSGISNAFIFGTFLKGFIIPLVGILTFIFLYKRVRKESKV